MIITNFIYLVVLAFKCSYRCGSCLGNEKTRGGSMFLEFYVCFKKHGICSRIKDLKLLSYE